MAKGNLFWHVPSWFEGGPDAGEGDASNVGADLAVALVDEHDIVHLGQDNFVCERLIGQYQYTSEEVVPLDHYIHSRVYVCQADSTTLALRNLNRQDDADSSFLWHNVELFSTSMAGNTGGDWLSSAFSQLNQPATSRNGSFDIRVNRRINEGTALVFQGTIIPIPVNLTFHLKLWVRLLLREA